MRDGLFASAIARIISSRAERALERSYRALRRGGDAELHALRIEFKRLRYTLEFIAPLASDRATPALEALALAQERLGTIADADTFARTYDELLAGLPAHDPRRAGLEMLRAQTERERTAALSELRALWNGASAAAYPETLAASISDALGSLSPKDA